MLDLCPVLANSGDGIAQIIFAVVVVVFVIIGQVIKKLMAKSGGGQTPTRRGPQQPTAARTPGGDIRSFLTAIGAGSEEQEAPPAQPSRPQQQRSRPAQQAPRGREGRTVHKAGDDEVRGYLESIGVQVQEEAPARPAAPQRRAPRPRPIPPQERVAEAIVVEAIAVEEPPGPAPPKRRRAHAPPGPQQIEPSEAVELLDVEASAPATIVRRERALGALGRLGPAPTMAELRRAVILAEVIGRPDFDRLPCERLKF